MENDTLPHSNLSNTAKVLCLINNGLLYALAGVSFVTMGVLNAAVADSIGCTDGYVTFVAAVSIAIAHLFGPVAEGVLKQIGMKYLTIVSSLVKLGSTCMLSTVNDAVSFAVWMILLGVGHGLNTSTSISVLGLIFSEHLSNAIGFVSLSFMIGIATPPAITVLLDNYGWRGAFLVIGALHLHGLVTATGLDPRIGRKQVITYTEIGKNEDDKTFLENVGERLQLRVFRDFKINGLFTAGFCIAFGEMFFFLSLIPYAISISIEPMDASFLKTFVGMGCVIARIAQCTVPQTVKISARLFVLLQILDVVALTIFITSNQYTVLAVTLFAHGGTFGMQTCLVYFLISKSVDTAYIGGAVGWSMAFYGLGHISAALVGLFYSDTNLLFCFQATTALQTFAIIPASFVLF